MSCSTEVDLNAPQKDIWVVYGVLDQSDSVQYIRISRGFLIEGDALEFARNNNLSEKGLQVKLTGNNVEYIAEQVDSIPTLPQDGLFYPFTSLYKIETAGNLALETAETYTLNVTKGDDPDFFLEATTIIPEQVSFRNPARNHRPGPGGSRCLIQASLELDYGLKFSVGSERPASGFEARVFLSYQENGNEKEIVYGPSGSFSGNVGCTDGTGTQNRCYEFTAGEVLRGFLADMEQNPSFVYTYDIDDNSGCQNDVADLPDNLRFEVTGQDLELFTYQRVNSPTFTDFNTVRPEYTNIVGQDSVITLGIFGSISKQSAIARLSPCSEFLLNLNGVPAPAAACSL
ncbi:MAG: hypothetical protein AAFY71_27040 [Bacteroidota bacterium]